MGVRFGGLMCHSIGQNYFSQNASSIRESMIYLVGHSCSYAETVIAVAQHISFPWTSTHKIPLWPKSHFVILINVALLSIQNVY